MAADFESFQLMIDQSAKKDVVFAQYFAFQTKGDAKDLKKAKFAPEVVGPNVAKQKLKAGEKPVVHAPNVKDQPIRAVIVRLQVDGGEPVDSEILEEIGPMGGAGMISELSVGYYGIDVDGHLIFLVNRIS